MRTRVSTHRIRDMRGLWLRANAGLGFQRGAVGSRPKECKVSNKHDYEAMEADYQVQVSGREQRPMVKKRQAPSHARRRGRTPQAFNGIHRRRQKKILV